MGIVIARVVLLLPLLAVALSAAVLALVLGGPDPGAAGVGAALCPPALLFWATGRRVLAALGHAEGRRCSDEGPLERLGLTRGEMATHWVALRLTSLLSALAIVSVAGASGSLAVWLVASVLVAGLLRLLGGALLASALGRAMPPGLRAELAQLRDGT